MNQSWHAQMDDVKRWSDLQTARTGNLGVWF